jgi:membrane dipeptidase
VIDPAQPTIERFIDHVDHAVSVMGIDRVVLGGDFYAQIAAATPGSVESDYAQIEGLPGPEDYPSLVAAMRRRGYEGERLEAILGTNLVRFLRRSLPG